MPIPNANPSPLYPEKKPHFFYRVAFDFLPEIAYDDLVYLSKLVEKLGNVTKYDALVDALVKMQWAKLAGIEAMKAEYHILQATKKGEFPFNPIAQAQHSKALFDFVAHTKASIDALAVFLNILLDIQSHRGDRDLGKPKFLNTICEKDPFLGKHLKSIRKWVTDRLDSSESVVSTRNKWIHEESPAISAMYYSPPLDIGYLPVPKRLSGYPRTDTPLTGEYYWSTKDFVEFHFKKLYEFYGAVILRCIQLAELKIDCPIERDAPAVNRYSFFPSVPIAGVEPKRVMARPCTPVFLDANTLLEELCHRILKSLSEPVAESFAKLCQGAMYSMGDPTLNFVFVSDQLGFSQESINQLEDEGLVVRRKMNLCKGQVLVFRFLYRGFRPTWPDDTPRHIEAIVCTRFGNELLRLVLPNRSIDALTNNITLLNAKQIDVKLLGISDYKDGQIHFDDMDLYKYNRSSSKSST